MTATVTTEVTTSAANITLEKSELKGPFEYSGNWDKHIDRHLTPAIGTQLKQGVQLSEILDNDKLVHELAVLISRRGVVIAKDQNITPDQQARLGGHLGYFSCFFF